jgi:hypothetical protein
MRSAQKLTVTVASEPPLHTLPSGRYLSLSEREEIFAGVELEQGIRAIPNNRALLLDRQRDRPVWPSVHAGRTIIAAESRGSSRRQLRGRRCDAASEMSQGRAAVGTRPSWTRSSIKSK